MDRPPRAAAGKRWRNARVALFRPTGQALQDQKTKKISGPKATGFSLLLNNGADCGNGSPISEDAHPAIVQANYSGAGSGDFSIRSMRMSSALTPAVSSTGFGNWAAATLRRDIGDGGPMIVRSIEYQHA